MSRKLKLKQKKARDKMINLIRKILKEHPRDTPKKDGTGRKLSKKSGDLLKNIKPTIKIEGNSVLIEVAMMEYYKWLDSGTSKMDGWFFSEEIMSSKEIIDITEDLIADGVEQTLLDMTKEINKK